MKDVATRSAAALNAFWRARGWDAEARVVKDFDNQGRPMFFVKSNIVNGHPTKRREAAHA